MSNEVIIALIGFATTVSSSFISWLMAKKKYNSEVDRNIIENMDKSLKFYESLSDDNKTRLEDLSKRNQALEMEVQELRKQVLNLTLNICMDLTCANRVREQLRKRKPNGKNKDRLDETEDLGSRGY